MRGIMDKRSRMHLEGWKSITRQKYAKLLLKAIYIQNWKSTVAQILVQICTVMMNGSITDRDTYAS
jgi:hypothetical protein